MMDWGKIIFLDGSIQSWNGIVERNKYLEVTKRISGLNAYQGSTDDWKNFEYAEDYVLSYELSGSGYLCGCGLLSKMSVYAPGTNTRHIYSGTLASTMKIVLDDKFELMLNGDLESTNKDFVNAADQALSVAKNITLDMERSTIEGVKRTSGGLYYCKNAGSGIINGAIPFGKSLKVYTGMHMKGRDVLTSGNPAPTVSANNEVDLTFFFPEPLE